MLNSILTGEVTDADYLRYISKVITESKKESLEKNKIIESANKLYFEQIYKETKALIEEISPFKLITELIIIKIKSRKEL